MAVHHMVWMKFHDGLAAEQIDGHLKALAAMPEKIPAIRDLHVAANFTDRAGGYTHGLIVVVDDREQLTAYLEHEEHVKVAGPLKRDAELMAMDIED